MYTPIPNPDVKDSPRSSEPDTQWQSDHNRADPYAPGNPQAAAKHQKNKVNPLVFAAPALLDTLGSFLNFSGLMLISSATYHVMRLLCLVFVVLLSVTVLRRRYTMAQYLGLALIIAGGLVVMTQSQFSLFDSQDQQV